MEHEWRDSLYLGERMNEILRRLTDYLGKTNPMVIDPSFKLEFSHISPWINIEVQPGDLHFAVWISTGALHRVRMGVVEDEPPVFRLEPPP